ncbi:MAG: DUF4864 domain-containing protein [Burkholderiales bacterium]
MLGDIVRNVLHALPALLLALAPLVASAQQPLPAADARAVRHVIEAQLEAFRRDDAARAFSYATPGIRRTFGTPAAFMKMVRAKYPVVYRPQSVRFDTAYVVQREAVQPVHMTDEDGHAWVAYYPMERQKNGAWRINGCRLAKEQATAM